MSQKDNPTTIEQTNIDGVTSTLPLALPPGVPVPEEKPLDRVKEQTQKKRSRERER